MRLPLEVPQRFESAANAERIDDRPGERHAIEQTMDIGAKNSADFVDRSVEESHLVPAASAKAGAVALPRSVSPMWIS